MASVKIHYIKFNFGLLSNSRFWALRYQLRHRTQNKAKLLAEQPITDDQLIKLADEKGAFFSARDAGELKKGQTYCILITTSSQVVPQPLETVQRKTYVLAFSRPVKLVFGLVGVVIV